MRSSAAIWSPYAAERGIAGVSVFFTVTAAVIFFARPLSGWLTDRLGIVKVLLPALGLFAASFVVVGLSKSLPAILVGAVLSALGYGGVQPTLQAMAIQTVTPLRRSVASNTLYAGIDLGFFIGPFLGSIVFRFSSFSVMYLAGVVPVLIGAVLFIIFWPGYVQRLKTLEARNT